MPSFQDTIRNLDSLQPSQFSTDAERYEAKEAARRLLNRLETPFEQGWRLSFETPVLIAGIQTILDLGIWKQWTEANKKNPGAPVHIVLILWVVGRFLRHIAALYVLEETDVDTWKPTPYSLSLGDTVSHTDQITQCGYVEPSSIRFLSGPLTQLSVPIIPFPQASTSRISSRNTIMSNQSTWPNSTTTAI